MTAFELVAIILAIFLGLGIAMGMLIVSTFARRRAGRYSGGMYLEGGGWTKPPPPGDDEQPRRPRWPHDGGFND